MNQPPMSRKEILAANIVDVQLRIAEAARRAGRSPQDVTLVAVSKTKPLEYVQMAYDLGIRAFGENRVQEVTEKMELFHPSDLHWHMIGHVQSKKAGKVVGVFSCIHSVDSVHLAEALQRAADKRAQAGDELSPQAILLQINVSGELSKEGMTAEDAPQIARQIAALPALKIQGLMTVAPLVDDPEVVRPVFRALVALRERLRQEVEGCSWEQLSMGMTDDYRIAIEEGATIVRVGRALFGERDKR